MTYEYECTACKLQFEVEHGVRESPVVDCPSCKSAAAVVRLVSRSNFILKGRGWSKDNYSK